MTYCNMYACLLTVMCLNMWDGCAADVPLSRGSGSVLQQLQQLSRPGGGPSWAAAVQEVEVEYEYSPKRRCVTTNNRTSAGPVRDPRYTQHITSITAAATLNNINLFKQA